MKKLLAFVMVIMLLLSSVYAEGVDEIEQVDEKEQLGEQTNEENEPKEENTPTQENQPAEEGGEPGETGQAEDTEKQDEDSQEGAVGMTPPTSQAEMFVVMEEDGSLLASSGAGFSLGLSSMTHLLLMTALDEKYKAGQDMGEMKAAEDFEGFYGGLDILAGEEFRALDLYKTLYLKSPDDVALLFANRDFGGEEGAVSELQALSSKLGLTSTTIGSLYGEGNASTLYDMAKLLLYNYRNSERFREAALLSSLKISETEVSEAREVITSSAFMMDDATSSAHQADNYKVYDKSVLAGKTYYGGDGTYIILTMLNKGDRNLVFATSGILSPEEAYQKHKSLQDKIINEYDVIPYLKAGSPVQITQVEGENRKVVEVTPQSDVSLLLPKNYDVKSKLELRYIPAEGGSSKIGIYKEGALYKTVETVGSAQVQADTYLGEVKDMEREKTGGEKTMDIVFLVLKILLVLILWLLAIAFNRRRIRRKKMRERNQSSRL